MSKINPAQQQRDRNGQRTICAACGHPARDNDPLIVADGFRIHHSHTADPRSGFYRTRQN